MKLRFLIILSLLFCACNSKKAPLEIYHTGNISGYFAQTRGEENKNVGGLPALKNLLSKKETPFLLFDSGNLFSTTREGQLAKLTGSLKLISALPYRAITLSAEDFKYGTADIEEALKTNKIPIVISNLKTQTNKNIDGIKERLVIEFEGQKIGILGVLSKNDFNKLGRPNGFKALDEVDTLTKQIENLKKENVDIIILLSSLGAERQDKETSDKLIAEDFPDIDIILGLGNKEELDNVKVIVAQAPENLQQVSLLKLSLNKNNQITSHTQEDILLDTAAIGEDEELLQEVNNLKQKVAKTQTRHIAKLDAYLDAQGQNPPLALYSAACLKRWGKAEIGLINPEILGEGLPQGDISEDNLYRAFPFDDKVMFLKMYGQDLLNALQNNLSNNHLAALNGIKIFYDDDQNIRKVLINDKPLQKTQLYDIALPDHLIASADYEDFLNMYEFKNTDRTVRDIIGWCLNRKNTEFNNESAWQKL